MSVKLKAVETVDLPLYPFGVDDRLPSHFFFQFWHTRWLNSSLHLLGDMAVQGAAINLFCIAQQQTPIGTLPDDDRVLARLLHISVEEWSKLRRMDPSPLHNWESCVSETGERRLMHPVVVQNLEDAFARREVRQSRNGARAVAARLVRLREAMAAEGVAACYLENDQLVSKIDGWLEKNCTGNRTQQFVIRALEHATAQGWLRGAS